MVKRRYTDLPIRHMVTVNRTACAIKIYRSKDLRGFFSRKVFSRTRLSLKYTSYTLICYYNVVMYPA